MPKIGFVSQKTTTSKVAFFHQTYIEASRSDG